MHTALRVSGFAPRICGATYVDHNGPITRERLGSSIIPLIGSKMNGVVYSFTGFTATIAGFGYHHGWNYCDRHEIQ